MQQGDRDVSKRDTIPNIRIDEEELSPPDSDDNEGISQMYANVSRKISKCTALRTSIQEDRLSVTAICGHHCEKVVG
jgi:hypothetical protein